MIAIGHFFTLPRDAAANPYGSYAVEPTATGIRFQVGVRHPRNHYLLVALIAGSFVVALITYTGFWAFLGTLLVLLLLVPLPYLAFAATRLSWIEVRPDGLAITPNTAKPKRCQFFDRRAISHRELDFDAGLTFRYGINDIPATTGFANEREFEIFEVQLEQAIARLWHQENLAP